MLYRGPNRTCFEFGEEDHQRDKCLRRQISVQVRPSVVADVSNN